MVPRCAQYLRQAPTYVQREDMHHACACVVTSQSTRSRTRSGTTHRTCLKDLFRTFKLFSKTDSRFTYVYLYIDILVDIDAYVYIYIYYMCVYIHVFLIHIYLLRHIQVHRNAYMYICIYTQVYTRKYFHTYTFSISSMCNLI